MIDPLFNIHYNGTIMAQQPDQSPEICFTLNGREVLYQGDGSRSLLDYLRTEQGITSVKDGCSGQAFCGACMVELDGKPALSCVTKMEKLAGTAVTTLEGIPATVRETLAHAFVNQGAVQCGFCTPGILTRIAILFRTNPDPSAAGIRRALRSNFCRCTGYQSIVAAVLEAARAIREAQPVPLNQGAAVGSNLPKYGALERALGQAPFVADLRFPGMLHGALVFSQHPRARVLHIDTAQAAALPGVVRVFTARDIPGERTGGLITRDWPLMVDSGETTRCVGDVLAGVVAESESVARQAADLVRIEYEVLPPLSRMEDAETSTIHIHPQGNLLSRSLLQRGGDVEKLLTAAAFTAGGRFTTQRIEHAFLECEAAVALPRGADGLEIFSQGQGVYEDRRQLALLLDLPEQHIKITQVPTGGAFGGKEDLSVQSHAALFCHLLQQPVRVRFTRPESIRFHPKRHPFLMDYTVGCDKHGNLTALRARILGDSGAYASVGAKVLERAAGHATGAYHFPAVDIEAKAVYTNNLPCGAMRGFGVNQVTFALEACLDDLCRQGGFDRWQFRYQNALRPGSATATGQILDQGVGVRACLEAIREEYERAPWSGLACGIKNCGVGNGMVDFSEVVIEILPGGRVRLHHGWTEMGQGVHTVARQALAEETGIDPELVEVVVCTEQEARSGMTTSSRGSSLLGKAVIETARSLRQDLEQHSLPDLAGKTYRGSWRFTGSTKPGTPGKVITHYSYSYAAQLAVLDEQGNLDTIVAAHDAGRIINPILFRSQIEGSVHMGLGYALSENLPQEESALPDTRLRHLGLLRPQDTPRIVVKGVEVADPMGPWGAKGVGEVGLVPTAAAVANAFTDYDGRRRFSLPLQQEVT